MSKKPNINNVVRDLLVNHLGFTDDGLVNNESLIRKGYDLFRDDFMKLIIDVKALSDFKKIENPAAYFIGALKNKLDNKTV